MKNLEFYEAVRKILLKDDRYHPDSYEFVNDAVIYTVKMFEAKRTAGESRHVSGQELLIGVTEYAIQKFGPLAYEVIYEWGIKEGMSVGNIVFNMLEYGLLSKTDRDSLEDFNVSIDFEKKLKAPFIAPIFFFEEQKPIIA